MAASWILLLSEGFAKGDLPPGYRRASDWAQTRASLEHSAPSGFMVDIEMFPEAAQREVFERYPDVPVFILTDDEHTAAALRAVAAGAFDYFRRPISVPELELALGRVETRGVTSLGPSASLPAPIVSRSPAMQRVHELVSRAATSDATVLIRGETGTGKDLVAHEIHRLSARAKSAFVKVHAAALPDNLLESELFGYEKGAFTGALRRKAGRVDLAQNGTLFLDEIGDISTAMQVKLLRILQDKQFERVGGTESLPANVRFLSATHRDLTAMVGAGSFREDLLYRLNLITVWLPPLRARREDIAPLALQFCESSAVLHGRRRPTLNEDALAFLTQQRWPGNVRQLRHLIERVVLLSDSPQIDVESLRASLCEEEEFRTEAVKRAQVLATVPAEKSSDDKVSSVRPLRQDVADAERHALQKALAKSQGNRTLAARLLGISRQTLYAKLEEYGLAN